MELTFGTGVFCPKCGEEIEYKGGFWKSFFLIGPLVDKMFARLNREGGTLTSDRCGHTWRVEPGSLNQ